MYTIRQASSLTGITPVTIRAWEQRYGVVQPVRSPAGYRLFTNKDIEDLLWLKRCLEEEGISISQAARLLQQQRKQQRLAEPPAEAGKDEALDDLSERLYSALLEFQTERARSLTELAFTMLGFEKTLYRLLVPLLIRVGDDWEVGKATVAQEHFITQFITQKCLSFFPVFPVDPAMPSVLALCPSGEQHQVGLLLFALYLRQKGCEVIYLGPDTPADGLEAMLVERKADYVCLSLTNPQFLPGALRLVNSLVDLFPHLKIILGGEGFAGAPDRYRKWILPGDAEGWNRWAAEELG
ncbi:MerR family transcriptional regulator [Paenibacillus aurantius]|uniref:MerR family transcriptional regulator n=1 Tax=Paenibacillus aurantius TaxID=2918900 RepID=A0AA96LD75_9BACL|nr:MerR family transcriptional regulator [Paenibacillus aurantius]WNQ10025.1 MerR family transcriptional regulator [Paenibacillus aurantius]